VIIINLYFLNTVSTMYCGSQNTGTYTVTPLPTTSTPLLLLLLLPLILLLLLIIIIIISKFRLPQFLDNRHTKVVRLSVFSTGRLYSLEIPLVLIPVNG
jgi:hypothetical protein